MISHAPQHHASLLIGAHLSIAGGLQNALYRGAELGCTCIQIFTHSNRQWNIAPLTSQEIQDFKDAQHATGIFSVTVHASYLINIASSDASIRARSLTALVHELERCEQLRIPYLVMHPGSAVGSAAETAIKHISSSINHLFERVPHAHTTLLLENMAGQGSVVGSTFEQLAEIRHGITERRRVGFCIDTCHAFAAGYSFSTAEEYTQFWHTYDRILGRSSLHAIHVNDSLKKNGSCVDRHAHIGEGEIGLSAFAHLMHDHHLVSIPKILETPKKEESDDRRNLATLRRLAEHPLRSTK